MTYAMLACMINPLADALRSNLAAIRNDAKRRSGLGPTELMSATTDACPILTVPVYDLHAFSVVTGLPD